jgi:hypothetical protein
LFFIGTQQQIPDSSQQILDLYIQGVVFNGKNNLKISRIFHKKTIFKYRKPSLAQKNNR